MSRPRPGVSFVTGAAPRWRGKTRSRVLKNFRPQRRIFLQYLPIATMCRSPKFARACGRVSIGRHPDKRPDSRLRLESYRPHYVIGSRRRNRRTPRSTGDAA